MTFIEWVQKRLVNNGFDPGIVDGIWGRNTLNALVAFQRARDLPAEGSLNEATLAALKLDPPGGGDGSERPARDLLDLFPWIELAQRKKGLREGADNATLRAFLASDGNTLGDPATRPWCGDFVETCIAVTLPSAVLPANPYLARNWLKFGRTVDPCFGAILVFWRGSRSGTEGHVGFYYAEDDSDFHVLGGNQSNKVSVAKIDKSRLLGARLPLVGGPYPRRAIRSQEDWERSVDEA
jgi:uncharacterized protein (TIGR02594 family)